MAKDSANPVLDVAKGRKQPSVTEVVLADGTVGRIVPVSAGLIDDVTARIPDPLPPMIYIEEKGREESNPSDPRYLQDLSNTARRRGSAALDAMVMFGLELPNGVPESNGWLGKLKLMQKLDKIDLSKFDLHDPIEREFLYKRYIAASAEVIELISKSTGVTAEGIVQAEQSFRSDAE